MDTKTELERGLAGRHIEMDLRAQLLNHDSWRRRATWMVHQYRSVQCILHNLHQIQWSQQMDIN